MKTSWKIIGEFIILITEKINGIGPGKIIIVDFIWIFYLYHKLEGLFERNVEYGKGMLQMRKGERKW